MQNDKVTKALDQFLPLHQKENDFVEKIVNAESTVVLKSSVVLQVCW